MQLRPPSHRVPAHGSVRPRTPHCIPDNEARKDTDNSSKAECDPILQASERTARDAAHSLKPTEPRACCRDNSASVKSRENVSFHPAPTNIGAPTSAPFL